MREAVRLARKQYEQARRDRKVIPATCCKRCGMTQEEHNALGFSSLQLHHIVNLSDGGHPTDPENLITLCKLCHDGWHKFAEVFDVPWDEWWAEEPIHLKYWKGRSKSN